MSTAASLLFVCFVVLSPKVPAIASDVGPTTDRAHDGLLTPDHPYLEVPLVPRPGRIALTFDDGPSPEWTPLVLDVLAAYDVRATFFVVGWRVNEHPEIVRRMVDEGHSVQNHTWSHRWLTREPTPTVVEQLRRGSEAIIEATGRAPHCVRPPFGALNNRITATIASLGLHPVMWDRDPQEWRGSSDRLTRYVVRHSRDGEVVLIHDTSGGVVVKALPDIIEGIRSRGLEFDTICDPLLQWDPPPGTPGRTGPHLARIPA